MVKKETRTAEVIFLPDGRKTMPVGDYTPCYRDGEEYYTIRLWNIPEDKKLGEIVEVEVQPLDWGRLYKLPKSFGLYEGTKLVAVCRMKK